MFLCIDIFGHNSRSSSAGPLIFHLTGKISGRTHSNLHKVYTRSHRPKVSVSVIRTHRALEEPEGLRTRVSVVLKHPLGARIQAYCSQKYQQQQSGEGDDKTGARTGGDAVAVMLRRCGVVGAGRGDVGTQNRSASTCTWPYRKYTGVTEECEVMARCKPLAPALACICPKSMSVFTPLQSLPSSLCKQHASLTTQE